MDEFETLANEIIDEVCEAVEEQHPEIILKTKYAKESDVEDPALIVGIKYYDLESHIAEKLKRLKKGSKGGKRMNNFFNIE